MTERDLEHSQLKLIRINRTLPSLKVSTYYTFLNLHTFANLNYIYIVKADI